MERGHCERGSQLYDLYQEKSLDLVVVDAENGLRKRSASRTEWLAMTQAAREAKTEYEKTRCNYIEHVVSCHVCEWDRLADSYLDAMEHRGLGPQSEEVAVGHW